MVQFCWRSPCGSSSLNWPSMTVGGQRATMAKIAWRIQLQRLLYLQVQVQVWGMERPLHANVRDLIE